MIRTLHLHFTVAAVLFGLVTSASAQSLPTNIEDLREQGFEAAAQEARAFRDEWIIPIYAAELDLETATVRWRLLDGDILVADATLLMMALPDGPATWAWAVDNPALPVSPAISVLRTHGQTHGMTELTTAQINMTDKEAARFAYPATLIDGVTGVEVFHQRDLDAALVVAYGPVRRIGGNS